MDWLAVNAQRRADPRVLWPQVRSIIMLGVNYGPEHDPRAVLESQTRGAISVYAQGDDYHDVIKTRLKALARWLVAQAGGDVKVFVDTAAVMEKPLAAAPGSAGRASTPISSRANSARGCFLGAIFTTLELPADAAGEDHCGSCRACLDVCPTDAFPAPYKLDARRCISYLTIEHKGRSRASFAPRWATASMAATIAWRPAPGTSSRRPAARPSSRPAKSCARPSSPNSRASTTRNSARCLQKPR
jgi:epoxyqueuosine reductase